MHITSFSGSWTVVALLAIFSPNPASSEILGSDRVRQACGSEQCMQEVLQNITIHATALRKGMKCHIDSGFSQGANGLVKRIGFDDGIEWAVKIVETERFHYAYEGVNSLAVVEKYCPELPIPKQYGQVGTAADGKLKYFFMEWIQGRDLGKECDFPDPGFDPSDTGGGLFSIPERLVPQLAEFVYNLTICPIPQDEMAQLITFGRGEKTLFANINTTIAKLPDTRTWVRAQFIRKHQLLRRKPSRNSSNGLDLMLLLAWVLKKFPENPSEPFVIHYWDLRPWNILVDPKTRDLKAVIDWDYVKPVPLRLSGLSLRHRLVDGFENACNPDLLVTSQDRLFLKDLAQIEEKRSGSNTLSSLYDNSDENVFVERVLFWLVSNGLLELVYPEYMEEALKKTPETLALAASEWEKFSNTYFRKLGRPLPDWPVFEEIQVGLGLPGPAYRRTHRQLKRKLQRQLEVVLERISERAPSWKWVQGAKCYLAAALSDRYILPSGGYSCIS